MALIKHKLPTGWQILYEDFFKKIIKLCNGALQKSKNLEDLTDRAAARANLGLSDAYVEKDNTSDGDTLLNSLKFAKNVWNKVGDTVMFGDKNIIGKFTVKSTQNGYPTGVALVAQNSSGNDNYGSLNYNGSQLSVDKPFHASQGFVCDTVNEADLNSYTKTGFFYGVGSNSVNILPSSIGTNDYAGISFGDYKNGSKSAPELAQLIADNSHVYYRDWDVATSWSAWKEFAFTDTVDSKIQAAIGNINQYAKTDASNLTAAQKNTWSTALATGAVASGNTKAVSGAAVYTAINNLSKNIFIKGMIIDWYGASNKVPTGWHICDGSNGTPDLRDKFVIGAGKTYSLNSKGGNPNSTASIKIAGNNIPRHNHNKGDMRIRGKFNAAWEINTEPVTDGVFNYVKGEGPSNEVGDDGSPRLMWYFDTAFNNGKGWTGNTSYAYGNTKGEADPISISIPTMPPFVALFKIMYIGA